MILYFLFACNEEQTTNNRTSVPSPYEYEFEQPATAIDLHNLGSASSEAVKKLHTFNAQPIIKSYLSSIEQSDGYCPTYYEQDGNTVWYADCMTESNHHFSGYSFYNQYEDFDWFGDGTLWQLQSLSGAADIRYEEHIFHWGGSAFWGDGTTVDGADTFFSGIDGTFYNTQSDQEWFENGLSALLYQYATVYWTQNNIPVNSFLVNGNMPVVDNAYLSAIGFSDIFTADARSGYPCPEEPFGSLQLRTTDGIWLEVLFDVNQQWELIGECDGCGIAYLQDEEFGEICIDMTPLIDWEGQPW